MKSTIFIVIFFVNSLSIVSSGLPNNEIWAEIDLSDHPNNSLSAVTAKVVSKWVKKPTCLERFLDFFKKNKNRRVVFVAKKSEDFDDNTSLR